MIYIEALRKLSWPGYSVKVICRQFHHYRNDFLLCFRDRKKRAVCKLLWRIESRRFSVLLQIVYREGTRRTGRQPRTTFTMVLATYNMVLDYLP
jgi:hypothetical protein